MDHGSSVKPIFKHDMIYIHTRSRKTEVEANLVPFLNLFSGKWEP
jgi:hypothetical protein